MNTSGSSSERRLRKSGSLGRHCISRVMFSRWLRKPRRILWSLTTGAAFIEVYLNTRLLDDWEDRPLGDRRCFLTGNEFGAPSHTGGELRTEVSNAEIWCECFGKNLQDMKPADSYTIAAMMSQIPGWERTTEIKKLPLYGRQRLYRYRGNWHNLCGVSCYAEIQPVSLVFISSISF